MSGRSTIFTSTKPTTLAKTYTLTAKGLEKTTAAEMVEGQYEVRDYSGVDDFAKLMASVRTDQAHCASVTIDGSTTGRIVTKANTKASGGALSRSKDCFELAGAGALILDYDPEGVALSRNDLWALLISICPALAAAGVVWWCSGSSFIFNGDHEMRGLAGQRFYVLVSDAADGKRFGEALHSLLWLAGKGRVHLSSSGSMLVRSTFDLAMHEPARLDFIGGAVCESPLSQRRGEPVILSRGAAGDDFLDTRAALPDLDSEQEARFQAAIAAAKAKAEPEALATRAAWKAARHGSEVARLVGSGVPAAEASDRANRTLDSALAGFLTGDFQLRTTDGRAVTPTQILDDLDGWNRVEVCHPLESDSARIDRTMIFTQGAEPTIHSFAHGGQTWKLRRQPARLCLVKGRSAEAASELLRVLERESDVFVRGGEAIVVTDGGVRPLDRHAMAHFIGTRVAAYSPGRERDTPVDVPANVIDMLLSIVGTMQNKEIKALALLPFARPDGSIVDRAGYDSQSGVYLHLGGESIKPVPMAPTRAETVGALRTLWAPWSAYQFATDADRGAMLSAILTAVCRPALELAPGYFGDAPAAGSGKTRCMVALGALMRNRRGGVTPHTSGQGVEQEMVKKLVAFLRAGEAFMCLDNCSGTLRSSVLAALLTEGEISERVLGGNHLYSGSARLLFTATGNNGEPDSDLGRRLVRVRIDTRCERPNARDFDFDPVDRALRDRLSIARAALVVIRWHQAAGAPKLAAGGAGFEQWSRLIRDAVLHAGGLTVEAGVGVVADPATSITSGAMATDSDTDNWRLVLRGLDERYEGAPFLAREVHDCLSRFPHAANDDASRNLHDGLSGLLGNRPGDITSTRIGHTLRNRRDRIVDGLVLRAGGKDRNGTSEWRVVPAFG